MKKVILSIILISFTTIIKAQIQEGVWRSNVLNADYHHFVRNGGGAAVYINQKSTENHQPILRLSSGSDEANRNVKFTVENNGSVGIGTMITGSHKLAVEGSIISTTFKSKNTNTDYHHFIRNGGGSAVYINQRSTESDKPILRLSSGSDEANRNVKFTVENNGSVGIGTILPGTWKLAVNGKIRAKEIKVETGWSDFVFDDDYKLPSLKEVEKHIEHKGHLKDIPSAKEVEEHGILLGAMDAKLLQKIEELTLYTIQQEKKLTQQSDQISELKSLVQQLLETKK